MRALLEEEARALLSACRIGRLGCIDNGEPYVVPINYVFEEDKIMKDNIEREAWASYLTKFSERNKSRKTWLQVFGEAGAQSEEQGLPLVGISIEEKGADAPRVQIMLGGHDAIESRHLTHMISNVERVTPQVGTDGRDDAIEFVDKQGEASLLIFTHRARVAADA